jgi:hypothetical protein
VLRAAAAAETAGIPSVSLVCEGFLGQAKATGQGLGFDDMRVARLVGHVDAQSAEEMLNNFHAVTVDQVVAGLVGVAVDGAAAAIEPDQRDTVMSGSIDTIFRTFVDRGWCDGLPFIPPTLERVLSFFDHTDRRPDETLGLARPSGRELTLWSVAVNGVMAGCTPEQMPVLVALAEVIADPGFGVEHSGNTTGADALIVLNGPSMSRLGFNYGQGALRDGFQANTAVGRWWRLYLRNVCGFTPNEHDKATFGNSMRVVLAEDEACLADIGWPRFCDRAGIAPGDDAVTVARYNSGMIVGSVYGSTPEQILPYLANSLTRVTGWELTHLYGLGHGQYRPLLILSPILARIFGKAGWTADDVRQALWERARIPARTFESLIGEWSNLTAGRRTLVDLVNFRKLPRVFAESDNPDRLVPITLDASCIDLAVAGDPSRTNAYVLSNDGPHGFPTSKRIGPRTVL